MSMNQPLVFNRIVANQLNLSSKEREISEFVMENTEFVTANTITDIARKINVSESSINRFCKKLGYKGFNDFKIDLVKDLTLNNFKNNAIKNRELSYTESVVMAYENTLIKTSANIVDSLLKKTVDAIDGSKRIFLIGTNMTKPAIVEFQKNLTIIGIQSSYYTDANDVKLIINTISEEDLVIIIAPNLFSNDLYNAMIQLNDNNIRIIGLTNYDSPQLNEILFGKFIAFSNSYLKDFETLSSNFPFIFICDVLVGKLIDLNPEYKKRRIKSETSITKDTFLYDSYL